MYQALLVAMSLGGLRLTWWIWTVGVPEKYVRPSAPQLVTGPITLDSDYGGLI